jgi:hypothetical protein
VTPVADLPALPPGPPIPKGKRFRGFPKNRNENIAGYDVARVKREFLAAPELEWAEYCQSQNYNPGLNHLPWRSWVREKKYRKAFNDVRADIEREGASVGPRLLLQQVRAVKAVPETASAMLSLIQHSIRIHLDEAKADEPHLKALREQGIPLPPAMRFTLDPAGCAYLASALKQTSELLHKSLGIDTTVGMTPERWAQLVEQEVGKIDGTQELVTQGSKNPVSVEVMGATSMRDAVGDAFQKWMDKPGAEEAMHAGVPSQNLPPEGEVDAEPEADAHG